MITDPKTTTESNMMIAEFMEFNNPHCILKYNISWDWLISVIDKIEKVCEAASSIDTYQSRIEFLDGSFAVRSKDGIKIERTYIVVVETISHYNWKKQKECKND